METILNKKELKEGKNEIIENIDGFKYPIKIVATVEEDIITIITCYPLKRRKNESIL